MDLKKKLFTGSIEWNATFKKDQDITSNTRTEVTQQDNELSAVTKTVRNIFNERMIFCKKPHNVIFAEYWANLRGRIYHSTWQRHKKGRRNVFPVATLYSRLRFPAPYTTYALVTIFYGRCFKFNTFMYWRARLKYIIPTFWENLF